MQCQKLKQIQEYVGDEFVKKITNVVGHGITNDGLVLFVPEKVSEDTIRLQSADQVIPEVVRYNGTEAKVHVIEVGNLIKMGYSQRVRPIVPGYSISHGDVTAGTLGGIFQDSEDVIVLSNNHVLSNENRAQVGDLIYQPGTYDQSHPWSKSFTGWNNADSVAYFATLKDFTPLSTTSPVNQDSAIAKIPQELLSSDLINNLYPSGKPITGFGQAVVGMDVHKFGRTTGHTTGKILATNAKFTIQYDIGPVTFEGCVVATSMSMPGDSGSLLLDDDNKAVALLFAGSDKVTLFNPIDVIQSRYKLSIWSPNQKPVKWSGFDWVKKSNSPNTIQIDDTGINITTGANQHSYIETKLVSKISSVSIDINTGTDNGASWGPGIAIILSDKVIKLNRRSVQGFGGYNDTEINAIGKSEQNTWYTLTFNIDANRIIAKVSERGSINTMVIFESELNSQPIAVRIGKMDLEGNNTDYSTLGQSGSCRFENFFIN